MNAHFEKELILRMNAHFEKELHFENESVFFGKVKVVITNILNQIPILNHLPT